jgi:hypothetical protein
MARPGRRQPWLGGPGVALAAPVRVGVAQPGRRRPGLGWARELAVSVHRSEAREKTGREDRIEKTVQALCCLMFVGPPLANEHKCLFYVHRALCLAVEHEGSYVCRGSFLANKYKRVLLCSSNCLPS